MCRYFEPSKISWLSPEYGGHRYKTHFVCFGCRLSFKYPPKANPRCPTCRKPMVDMGHDFRVPRKEDANEWRKVELLYQQGFRFESCGCRGPGYAPKTYAEAKMKKTMSLNFESGKVR